MHYKLTNNIIFKIKIKYNFNIIINLIILKSIFIIY